MPHNTQYSPLFKVTLGNNRSWRTPHSCQMVQTLHMPICFNVYVIFLHLSQNHVRCQNLNFRLYDSSVIYLKLYWICLIGFMCNFRFKRLKLVLNIFIQQQQLRYLVYLSSKPKMHQLYHYMQKRNI